MSNLEWFKTVFLKHLKRAKAAKASFTEFVALMFRVRVRSIETLKCIADHELRGALWVDAKPVQGLIDRRVLTMRRGQAAWLRSDDGESFVTLENSRGVVNVPKSEWYRTYARYYK
jgi:hypothetical protein